MANKITFQDAKVIFRNFAGAETDYNAKGLRNFCVVVPDEETAEALQADGWVVKTRLSKVDPDAEPLHFIKVKVRFDNYPPKVYLVTSKKKTLLDEDTIGQIDKAEIERADLQISQSHWTRNGKTGVTAYLDKAYFKIKEDELEMMYADIPEGGESTGDVEIPFN